MDPRATRSTSRNSGDPKYDFGKYDNAIEKSLPAAFSIGGAIFEQSSHPGIAIGGKALGLLGGAGIDAIIRGNDAGGFTTADGAAVGLSTAGGYVVGSLAAAVGMAQVYGGSAGAANRK
ncbi:hypothetical protein FF124_19125 [Martelella lutilitoris]|uniref:Uncharacterized protein n=1 Tax=Martelella lutilitoris TaxID=2583532 RepID=A0A5C4JLE5_9HYPH|nr:hypothetical protein [Martelella lutilitoris]TNB46263.1 hypothetical protein FF124_19125 [Martelella lutilitoris]